SITKEDQGWQPGITIKQILVRIQDLLDQPNEANPAHSEASQMCKHRRPAYIERVRQQAAKYTPP
ncbi:unnamed protein product, partial [Discosporangium mesarthrocarpum]